MIRILSAQEKDIPFIIQVNREIDRQNAVTKDSYLNEETLKRDVFTSDPAAYVDIAFHGDEPVGLVLYTYGYFASSGRIIWISQIYTKPTHRKQGIARDLLNSIKAAQAKKIHPAQAMYWATKDVNQSAQTAFESMGATKLDGYLFYSFK